MNIIFCSGGNDSIALIQWAIERQLSSLHVVYSDTGWAKSDWSRRIKKLADFCFSAGIAFHILKSEGMETLVRRKKGFPSSMGQFCTTELKMKPALKWLERMDPSKEAVCLNGVRREESQRRRNTPEFVDSSEFHGGRELWSPLVRVLEAERNALIERAGFEVLPHRSSECWPCVNANINDLRELDEQSICRLEQLENSMGVSSNGKPRVMFRPARKAGAVGIRAVVDWAKVLRDRDQLEMFSCSGGYCGI